MPRAQCHLLTRPMPGGDGQCGDAGLIRCGERTCFVALVDGLGHGAEAARAARAATDYLGGHADDALEDLLCGLHEVLKGTRGAVAFLARLDIDSGELRYAGVGNICAKVFGGDDPVRLRSKEGVAGYMMPTPREGAVRLLPRDVLVLSSDGLREHFEAFEHPDLLRGDAECVSKGMMERFSKSDDDASCLVMRYLR